MQLHNLPVAEGAAKPEKRVGRGIGSRQGKTSGRGHKGLKQRSGGKVRLGFEGGQMPLQRRVPHLRGFKSLSPTRFTVINVGELEVFEANSVVGEEELLAKGLIRKKGLPIKILGNGDLSKSLVVKAHGFSQKAVEKIETARGSTEVI
ncbi:50S ribosomal protein L15 [Candidatus Hakubella thermalkaliphila]|uniref:50S ribosomal protein L15 n=1 Tax=Candidatus Hakubella thermalkaliphila TaxID=2754717 RepID=UPI001593ADEE|nr:50S ribosomal protein L15 [Candidatus Hakubella thermalkaliphila]